jgi:hypothetical protein
MKRAKKAEKRGEIQEEYDFRPGIRGKYANRFGTGTVVVVLEPDVARVFSDSRSVNQTLRTVARLSRRIANG